jgi:NadR type nicotinamide-nucleotide adenylyltransferase
MRTPNRLTKGFVLGKFMPPHQGHLYFCDFARNYCEQLTILVCSLPDDPIPGDLRFSWMRELFPTCDVRWHSRHVPQEPADHPDFWTIWRDIVLDAGGAPDVIFASEFYGHRLAAEVGALFVPVDPARQSVPTSGTAIRANPFAQWQFLPPPVRSHFVRRVCVFGPESTGKTTLATTLARRLDTVVAPEYGRTFTAAFGTDLTETDLEFIVKGHLAGVAAARRQANRILIEDTDPALTAVWSDMLFGRRAAWLEDCDLADLYLLLDTSPTWINDGSRYFQDQHTRDLFYARCEAELTRRGARFVPIRGSDWTGREEQALAAIAEAFPDLGALK